MERFPDIAYRLAFATFRNVNLGVARTFAEKGIGPEEFFTLPTEELTRLTNLHGNVFRESLRTKTLEAAREEAEFMERHHITPLFWDDESYPVRLSHCDDAPAVLFVAGNPDLNYSHVVSIVGTRHCTAYGAEMCRQLVRELHDSLDNLLIISGLAYGIDISAHRAALDSEVPTGAILAHGLRTLYPAEHRADARRIIESGGFLATEYTSDAPIHRGQFLARNRIVAGLADVVVIVESDLKGGAMSTARIANAYNREVMAVPGRVTDRYSRGTNSLIFRNEATLARDAADIIAACGWAPRAKEGQQQTLNFQLSDQQKIVVEFLRTSPDSTINEICMRLAIPFSDLSAILFELEMDGIIASIPGGRYCIIDASV